MTLNYNSSTVYSSSLYTYDGQLATYNLALAQNQYNTNHGSGASIVIDPTYTAGNTLIAGIGLVSGSVSSVTDTLGNPWIQAAFAKSGGGNSEIWYSRGIHGGAASVTVVVSNSSASVRSWYSA